ncbi:hypothetical protein CBM2592_A160238 [Cupriavidus taiwanensis]|nr:hypothetical protein CBM2592_A160238 [Cupriavidus taiwanensis]SOY81313.1 hypothetical protein CBM2591_A190237 [Cupriavidus taiwanensis]SPA44518.1 hypothetical protein CBM2629_A150320 [Cupriavidus taiwanensis]SPD43605.1 protein of unknown function [Cupriavidus taiwanensis]
MPHGRAWRSCPAQAQPEKKNGPDLAIQAVFSITYFWSER